MYMQEYDVINDRIGIGIPAVHAIATSTHTKHEKRFVTAQAFIYEQAKDSFCCQMSSTVALPGSKFN